MYMSRCGHNAMTTTTQNFSRKEITLSQQSRECIIIGYEFFPNRFDNKTHKI